MTTVSKFFERCLELRDSLALRKARGESLSPREERVLQKLNIQLDRIIPSPPSLPREARELMEEVKRLRDSDQAG